MTDASARSASNNDGLGAESINTSRMSFGDHLDELRVCLVRALVGVAFATGFSLFFGKKILELIYHPLLMVQHSNGLQPSLQVLAPTAAFLAYLKIGFLCGLILAMPWVLHQGWVFVSAGLYRQERRFVKLAVPTSAALFGLGVAFLYFVVLPIVLNFFISFNKDFAMPDLAPGWLQGLLVDAPDSPHPIESPTETLKLPVVDKDPESPAAGQAWVNTSSRRMMINTPSGIWSVALEPGTTSPAMHSQFALDYYVSFVLTLALAFGIAFQTPIVVYFLAWTGLASTAYMKRGRRYVLLGTVLASAMLTPPDVISQLLLAGPMYLLFEFGLLIAPSSNRPPTADGIK